jgi:predicted AAA+ superfamily ATPase
MRQIARPTYIHFLNTWKNQELIKVVSGVRRCGKSTLFEMFRAQLLKEGVAAQHIVSINFEDLAFDHLLTATALHAHLQEQLPKDTFVYLFLDEIQNVQDFERVVNSLRLNPHLDIYITGSNAYFLSGELATMLTGRYVELKMLPLSFAEYYTAYPAGSKEEAFNAYLQTSFPYASSLGITQKMQYLEGLYASVVLKDIVKRLHINEVNVLERLIRYVFAEIGNVHSVLNLTNALNAAGTKISHKTVANYLSGIEESMLVYRARRYNLKGKRVLNSNVKYYAVDMGLRRYVAGDRSQDYGHILENIIYLELRRRGYEVYVGVLDQLEVDFLALKPNNERLYVQVAYRTEQDTTLQRELKPLQQLKDNFPKLLLTLDTILPEQNFEGIQKLNAIEWLLSSYD